MKYPSLKAQAEKTYDIKALSGGINDEAQTQNMGDTQIAHGKNVWYKNGVLQSRKGLSFLEDMSMHAYSTFCNLTDFIFTDTTAIINGKVMQIAYAIFNDFEADAEIHTAFLADDGSVTFAQAQHFFRFNGENFYEPRQVNFFNTKNSKGEDTLFMMVLRENEWGEFNTEVYEQTASGSTLSWLLVSDENYYAPIVLMDGRGNGYLKAVEAGAVERFTPYNPESANLFTGWCRSYFTCDGYSHQFKTPCASFAPNESVYVVYHGTGNKQTFEIPAETNGVDITILGNKLTLYCNRSNGSISFAKDSAPYPLPVYYECSNNLLVTAKAGDSAELIEKVASSKGNFCYNSKAFFYNNRFEENEICYMDLRKSFYAPEQASIKVGNGGFPITTIKELAGKIFVFKPDEIYTVDINYGKQAQYYIFPLSLDEKLFYSDNLSAKCVNNRIGCALPKTLVTEGKKAMWLGTDKSIYTMDTSGSVQRFKDLSKALDSFNADELESASASRFGEYYVLCVGSEIILVNCEDKGYYRWELPKDVKCMAARENSDGLLLGIASIKHKCAYFSKLCDDVDTALTRVISDGYSNRTFITETQKIPCEILSKSYDLSAPCDVKTFDNVVMNIASSGGFFITFDGKNKRFVPPVSKFRSLKLLPHLSSRENIEFKIETDGYFALGDIKIQYRTVDNKF